jgi:hypothetical protein
VVQKTAPDNDDQLITLSLHDDPEPALQRAHAQIRLQIYGKVLGLLVGGIGLVVVLAQLHGVFNDYVAHKQELPALIARGRRVPAHVSGTPVHIGRRGYRTTGWQVKYSYTVGGRAHAGSALYRDSNPPASIVVVFDPQNPAAHRAVGSMEPSNLDGRRLITLGAEAAVFGFILLVSGPIEWLKQLRGDRREPPVSFRR